MNKKPETKWLLQESIVETWDGEKYYPTHFRTIRTASTRLTKRKLQSWCQHDTRHALPLFYRRIVDADSLEVLQTSF